MHGAAGSAPARHAGGHRFKSCCTHSTLYGPDIGRYYDGAMDGDFKLRWKQGGKDHGGAPGIFDIADVRVKASSDAGWATRMKVPGTQPDFPHRLGEIKLVRDGNRVLLMDHIKENSDPQCIGYIDDPAIFNSWEIWTRLKCIIYLGCHLTSRYDGG